MKVPILAALLLPALDKAKRDALNTGCLSNWQRLSMWTTTSKFSRGRAIKPFRAGQSNMGRWEPILVCRQGNDVWFNALPTYVGGGVRLNMPVTRGRLAPDFVGAFYQTRWQLSTASRATLFIFIT
jgi:hypothetical protein